MPLWRPGPAGQAWRGAPALATNSRRAQALALSCALRGGGCTPSAEGAVATPAAAGPTSRMRYQQVRQLRGPVSSLSASPRASPFSCHRGRSGLFTSRVVYEQGCFALVTSGYDGRPHLGITDLGIAANVRAASVTFARGIPCARHCPTPGAHRHAILLDRRRGSRAAQEGPEARLGPSGRQSPDRVGCRSMCRRRGLCAGAAVDVPAPRSGRRRALTALGSISGSSHDEGRTVLALRAHEAEPTEGLAGVLGHPGVAGRTRL